MNELLEKLGNAIAEFQKDSSLQMSNGNKAAGARARKTSLEIEKMLKDFRKASISESKK